MRAGCRLKSTKPLDDYPPGQPSEGRLTAEQDRLPRYRLALTPTGE